VQCLVATRCRGVTQPSSTLCSHTTARSSSPATRPSMTSSTASISSSHVSIVRRARCTGIVRWGGDFPPLCLGTRPPPAGIKVQMRSKLETSFAISLCLSSRGPVTVLFLHIFRSLVMSNASQGFIPVNSVILLVHLSLNKLHGFCNADNATTVLFSGNFALDPPPSVLPPFPGILAPDRHSDLQVLTSYHIVV